MTDRSLAAAAKLATLIVAAEMDKAIKRVTLAAATPHEALAARLAEKAKAKALHARIAAGDAALIANVCAAFDAEMLAA